MANMSYCRFENTSNDLLDCYNAMVDDLDEGLSLQQFYDRLSTYEKTAFQEMLETMRKFNKVVSQEVLKF